MGKSETHVVHVPRWVTVLLLLAVSAAMVEAIHLLSGRAYLRESSFRLVSATASSLLAIIAPAIADALFFLPWGALAFLSLDRAAQPRKTTYFAVIALGVAFALGLVAWQTVLPTRVTGGVDAMWNAVGCTVGATLGHARKRIRVRFES